ncbi:MAG: UTP--glucose-1-phosphate uridylyltransferase GalU [Gammaproteobacteria bacterium]
MKIKKAIFPVAGLGSRFLPATKAIPKEMLPIVDKPLIQYAVEEALDAGVEQMIFVTGRTKNAIMDHFDKAYELETELEQRNKDALLEIVRSIVPEHVSCIYIRQAEALGLGHAVLCAEPAVDKEPVAVILADDLIDGGKQACLSQMVKLYDKHNCSVLGVETVPHKETEKYGVVSFDESEGVTKVTGIVEKPKPEDAPSNLAVVGRYVLTPEIFNILKTTGKGAGGEIQLTDAIAELLRKETVLAHAFTGKRYDCGSKLGYLQANVEYAFKHDELSQAFKNYLSGIDLVN